MERIFPQAPGRGRDLVIERCQNCHSLAPVVINVAQMDDVALKSNMLEVHLTGYVTAYGFVATEAEMILIYEYLRDYIMGKPIPDVPQSWIEAWTYY